MQAVPEPKAASHRWRQRLGDVAFVAFIVLCMVVAWTSLHYHGRRLEEESLAARTQIATLDVQHLESHVALTLRGIDLTLQALLESGPPPEATATWNGLLQAALRNSPQLRSLSLLQADGRVIASSNTANLGLVPSLERYLPPADGSRSPLRIGPPQAGRDFADARDIDGSAPLPALYFVPVLSTGSTPDGERLYLLAALNMEYFLNSGALPERGRTDHLEILDFNGQRLLDDETPSTAEMLAANRRLTERWKAGDEHGSMSEDVGADTRYTAVYRVTRNFPLGVVARFDRDAARAGAREERGRQEGRLLPAIVLGLGATLLAYVLFRRAGSRERAAREAAECALRESEERYRLTMGAVRDGMWEWAVDSGELRWDARCMEQLGHAPAAALLHYADWETKLHPEDRDRIVPLLPGQLSDPDGFSNEFRLLNAHGEWHWIESRGKVVEWREDKPLRVVGTHTDIHARKTGEARLRLLEAALNAAANAVVITNPEAVIEWVNPAFTALSGYAENETIGRRPRDLIKSGLQSGEYYAALWNTILAGDVWRGELINRHRDGSLYHEALTITPIRDEHGTLDHFIAVKEDISARKAAEAELDAAHARLRAVVDNFPGAVVLEAPDGTITLANQALCDLLNLPGNAADLVGSSSAEVVDAVSRNFTDAESFVARIQALREAAKPVHGEDIQMAGGRWLERDFVPVHTGSTLLGFLRLYRDVTERKLHEQALQRLATVDPLTGALNRRAFLDHAEHERLRLQRSGHPATLVMLDLDHFKRINDTWGHAAGDAVLCHFVRLLQRELRATDVLGRIGGEEFALLLVDTGLAGALELTERLRTTVATEVVVFGDADIRVTVSAGVTAFEQTDRKVETALARADEALYRAKADGRNRIATAPLERSDDVTAD